MSTVTQDRCLEQAISEMTLEEFNARRARWAEGFDPELVAVAYAVSDGVNRTTCHTWPSLKTIMGRYLEGLRKRTKNPNLAAPCERTLRRRIAVMKQHQIVNVVQRIGHKRNTISGPRESWFSTNLYTFDFGAVIADGDRVSHDFLAPLENTKRRAEKVRRPDAPKLSRQVARFRTAQPAATLSVSDGVSDGKSDGKSDEKSASTHAFDSRMNSRVNEELKNSPCAARSGQERPVDTDLDNTEDGVGSSSDPLSVAQAEFRGTSPKLQPRDTTKRRSGNPNSPDALARTLDKRVRAEFRTLPVNIEGVRKHISTWLKSGATPEEVRAMIDLFCSGKPPQRRGIPLWRSFVWKRDELLEAVRASQVTDQRRQMTDEESERYWIG